MRSNWKRVACTFRAGEIIRNNTFHWHATARTLTISYFLDSRRIPERRSSMKEIIINVTGKLTGLENDRFIIRFQMILISTCVNNSINMQKTDSVTRLYNRNICETKTLWIFFKISETKIKISKLIIRCLLFRCMHYYIDINFSLYIW